MVTPTACACNLWHLIKHQSACVQLVALDQVTASVQVQALYQQSSPTAQIKFKGEAAFQIVQQESQVLPPRKQ